MTDLARTDWRLGLQHIYCLSHADRNCLLRILAENVAFSGFWEASVNDQKLVVVEEKIIADILPELRKHNISYKILLKYDPENTVEHAEHSAQSAPIGRRLNPNGDTPETLRDRVWHRLRELSL